MNFLLPLRPLLKGWIFSFLAYGMLAFVLVFQFFWTTSMPLGDALRMAARDWLPWALATPLLFRFVSRFPLERERWKTRLLLHLICALATLAFCTWWAENVIQPVRPFDKRPVPAVSGAAGWPGQGRGSLARPPGERQPRYLPRPPGLFPGNMFFFLGYRLPIYLAVVSIAHALCFYRRAQERERRTLGLEAGLAKARLSALRMQLQPHFLFNSLNAIAELVHKDPEAADEMLVALANLLRLTLETSGEQELPLSREMEFVERYLAIERVRLGDRLHVTFDLAPGTRNALVPVFLLQPLVENAVRHGLEAQGGPGRLAISAGRRDAALVLTISDNGPGLQPDKPLREGIGLANTRARLEELYGPAGTLEFRRAEGFTVVITIPFRTSPDT